MKTRPPKYIDPYSKKAVKMRDRQLREEEWELQKYRSDDEFADLKQKIKRKLNFRFYEDDERDLSDRERESRENKKNDKK
jgi:hypothetical protein